MTATTTRLRGLLQSGRGDVITSCVAAPTRTVAVGGVDFADRERFVERALAHLGGNS